MYTTTNAPRLKPSKTKDKTSRNDGADLPKGKKRKFLENKRNILFYLAEIVVFTGGILMACLMTLHSGSMSATNVIPALLGSFFALALLEVQGKLEGKCVFLFLVVACFFSAGWALSRLRLLF